MPGVIICLNLTSSSASSFQKCLKYSLSTSLNCSGDSYRPNWIHHNCNSFFLCVLFCVFWAKAKHNDPKTPSYFPTSADNKQFVKCWLIMQYTVYAVRIRKRLQTQSQANSISPPPKHFLDDDTSIHLSSISQITNNTSPACLQLCQLRLFPEFTNTAPDWGSRKTNQEHQGTSKAT